MSFDDFAQLCGVNVPPPISNSHSKYFILFKDDLKENFVDRTNVNNVDIDESLKAMLDNRVNCLRDDFKDDLNRTKLSMQMNFIVELERLRVNSSFFFFLNK